jgi:hypothetical protein
VIRCLNERSKNQRVCSYVETTAYHLFNITLHICLCQLTMGVKERKAVSVVERTGIVRADRVLSNTKTPEEALFGILIIFITTVTVSYCIRFVLYMIITITPLDS